MKKIYKLVITSGLCFFSSISTCAAAQDSSISDVVGHVIDGVRSGYASMVVQKLERDGTGASAQHTTQKGYVPTAKKFIRRVSFDTIAKSKRVKEKRFVFTFDPGGSGNLTVKIKDESLSAEQKALLTATILDSIVRSTRGTYTSMIVRKLKKDGVGASAKHLEKNGFVPLPAVFVRNIFSDLAIKQVATDGALFKLSLRSNWNLNPQQGLEDGFEKEGWDFLVKQQQTYNSTGKPLRKLVWQPYVKKVSVDGGKSLRYLSADPAASKSCVSCHNQWEKKAAIRQVRASQGLQGEKKFKLHELMGALSIVVPFDG